MTRLLPFRRSRLAAIVLLATASAVVAGTGCTSLGYYAHVASGHAQLLRERESIQRLVEDPETDAALRSQLQVIQDARRFAVEHLNLPDNRSYSQYVALDRPFVTWAVFAAPEFSVSPVTHCFPFAGCVAYRGYFTLEHARAEAKRLTAQGLHTHIGGVGAYSTLGWFADPVLSTMLDRGIDSAVATLFHELVHQKLYVRDDTAFNESLAMFVEREGMRQWREARQWPSPDPGQVMRARAFTERVLALREDLRQLYAAEHDVEQKRAGRERLISAFRDDHRALRAQPGWLDDARFDAWVDGPINNASLLPFGLYDQWVDAFARLFERSGRDWRRFHAAAALLAELPVERRRAELEALQAPSAGQSPLISTSSTSNTSEAPGGIRLPAPRSP